MTSRKSSLKLSTGDELAFQLVRLHRGRWMLVPLVSSIACDVAALLSEDVFGSQEEFNTPLRVRDRRKKSTALELPEILS